MLDAGSTTCPLPGEPAFAGVALISAWCANITLRHLAMCSASGKEFESERQTLKALGVVC